ncbi:MAG TPA: GNAT family N-acetyltransferase [Anaeromyxobacteraceae bacterium]|jgi:GNAT superfamily N-acetyltransferase|nr:GNAT family N-acetyltransferase [Anaeromyxobacteraceae bacterium]
MIEIREATAADVPLLLQLIRDLAEYEKLRHEVVATEADLLRDGFGPERRFRALVALSDGAPAGFALWFFNYSTFQGRGGLYLEDLFVKPELRGRGLGKALFARLARLAVENRCGRFVWQVLDWNAPSIAFYEGLGAKRHPEWVTMRLAGEPLARLAAQDVA